MVDALLVKGQPVEALFTALEAVTEMLPEKKAVTNWAKALDGMVKAGQQLIAQNKLELEARKKIG